MQQIPEQVKLIGDGAAVGLSVAAILQWIPHVAAVVSLVWALMRCYSEYLDIKAKRNKR